MGGAEREDIETGLPAGRPFESAAMFRQLAESGDQVFVLTSDDFKTVYYVSPSYAKVWGKSCESLYRHPESWLDSVHPADQERIKAALAASQGGRLDFQYRIRRADGVERWILARSEKELPPIGGQPRVCLVAVDITDLKNAQAELAKSELKYRRLFEAAKDGVLILDLESGTIIEINPFLLQLLGYPAADCVGKLLWDLGLLENVDATKKLFAELQSSGYVRYDDLPLKAKDGRVIPVEFVSNVYPVNGSSVIQCNIRDISARKRDEAGLRRLASLIDSSENCIVGTSLDGTIESWNPACEALFGYRAADVIGKNISIICPARLRKDQEKNIADILSGKSVVQYETVRVAKGGKAIEVSLTLSQIKDADGRAAGISGVITSIAKNKLLEAQLRQSQKMEGIGRLAGGIAHDFNNLLTAIMGYSEILLKTLPAEGSNREDVQEIMRAGERAAALTGQLLSFSRQQVLVSEVLDLNAVVAELDKMLGRIIGEDITLTFLPGVDLGRVSSDPGRLGQVIMNLCVNAKDAMPKGGKLLITTANVELDAEFVASHPGGKAGPYVMLAVSDSGAGMSETVYAHLFEPFFTTKEQGKGTGLGLATVYGIIKQSGGFIDVYSEVGLGTTFKVYLPRVAAGPVAVEQRLPAARSYRGTETILLVEDDAMVQRFALRVLKENGYRVLAASTPHEAIAICEKHEGPIHLMLSDIVMPEMRGFELARRLVPARPEMRVIFMSGYTEQSIDQLGSFERAGFIEKPMSAETIVREIRKALDGAAGPS